MQLYLLILLQFVITGARANYEDKKSAINGVLQDFGFSSACVSQSLAECENSVNVPTLLDIKNQLNSLKKSLDREIEPKYFPRNCADLQDSGDNVSGVRTVYPFNCCSNRPVSVYCDQTTDGGGWTVFQHREDLPLREDFFRKWTEYKLGFGNLTGEFWLGLDNIHALSSQTFMELRVDLEDYDNVKRWAKYESFYIGNEDAKYKLSIGKYSGDAGGSLTYHNEAMFSTNDQDNDTHNDKCAVLRKGAWWYHACTESNLNGYQFKGDFTSYADGIVWYEFRGKKYSLKKTSLSLRPKFRT